MAFLKIFFLSAHTEKNLKNRVRFSFTLPFYNVHGMQSLAVGNFKTLHVYIYQLKVDDLDVPSF